MNTRFIALRATTACLAALALPTLAQSPLDTSFSYQGQLKQSGVVVEGTADFEFRLFDAVTGGTQIGATHAVNALPMVAGALTLELDFGADAFNGDARWLEVGVRSPAGGGTYTTLSPRQAITAAPYALHTRGVLVDAANRVGIGTSAPQSRLHVAEQTDSNAVLTMDSGATAPQFTAIDLRDRGASQYVLGKHSNNDFFLDEFNAGRRLTIRPDSGNVGIGVVDPQKNLSVRGGLNIDQAERQDGTLSDAALTFGYSSAEGIASKRTPGGNQWGLDFYTQSFSLSPRMSITWGGNVGIGTSSPIGRCTSCRIAMLKRR